MVNGYYSRMYGMFKPADSPPLYRGDGKAKFINDWKKITDKLKSLDYDFSTIYITGKK